ncbi:MAG TPA: amidohydrolase family protein [Stellaceae bacterium]|nr:amidohydrolase family protein [Stellaceae bacterium]
MDTINPADVTLRDVSLAEFDTPTILKNGTEQAIKRRYEDFCMVDVDSHHYESESFSEILKYIEDPVLRHQAQFQGMGRNGITGPRGGYQDMDGRVARTVARHRDKIEPNTKRDVALTRRWMDALGVDITCLFPTPMLALGLTPRAEVEVALARAYNRWLVEEILPHEPRMKSMLYLPYNEPKECLRMVEDFGDKKGVIGFCITAPHYRGVYDNAYAKTYAALEERGLPLSFHSAFMWGGDRTMELCNRFISVHALGFTFYNMVHLTNWLVNGMPERYPKLKVIWIESGLAWLMFLIQRLDNEYMMRSNEAPLLKRKPSEYIREMYFTTQPMEMVENREELQLTFKRINAETQLLYSSDYPHWDMDLPSTIYDLPFLSEQAKRNILGGNALRLFNLEPTLSETKKQRLAAREAAQRTAAQ